MIERINFRLEALQSMALPALVERYNALVAMRYKSEAQLETQEALRFEIERRTGQKLSK